MTLTSRAGSARASLFSSAALDTSLGYIRVHVCKNPRRTATILSHPQLSFVLWLRVALCAPQLQLLSAETTNSVEHTGLSRATPSVEVYVALLKL